MKKSPCTRPVTVIVLTALVVGCGGSSMAPSTMAPSTIDGTYIGTIVDSNFGSGTARVTLASDGPDPTAPGGTDVSGSWSMTFANANDNENGSVMGLFHDPSFDFAFDGSTCSFIGRLTLGSTSLNGFYGGCNNSTGTITLTKR
jgi:hypothetical protein